MDGISSSLPLYLNEAEERPSRNIQSSSFDPIAAIREISTAQALARPVIITSVVTSVRSLSNEESYSDEDSPCPTPSEQAQSCQKRNGPTSLKEVPEAQGSVNVSEAFGESFFEESLARYSQESPVDYVAETKRVLAEKPFVQPVITVEKRSLFEEKSDSDRGAFFEEKSARHLRKISFNFEVELAEILYLNGSSSEDSFNSFADPEASIESKESPAQHPPTPEEKASCILL